MTFQMQLKFLKKRIVDIRFFAKILRHKFAPYDFLPHEKLYRGFKKTDLPDESGELEANSFKFPDYGGISCNWCRFSKPEDVKKRSGGSSSDGCYSIKVEVARYNGRASTCHDPFPKLDPRNYSHMEIRQLSPTDNPDYEPPKTRRRLEKKDQNWSKSDRLAYRLFISQNVDREIEPT
jgi:hypothetical protein